MSSLMTAADLRAALTLRDLTDPRAGPHAMQRLVRDAVEALTARWGSATAIVREPPLVTVADNYDHLGYPVGGAARDARYTRYVRSDLLLRTQMSAVIPRALDRLASAPLDDVLLACPGLVYRRDAIDRRHVGEPHQLDLWRIRRGAPLAACDLQAMIAAVLEAVLPGRVWRTSSASHPYTVEGLQIDVAEDGGWLEVGECGLAAPTLLRARGLEPDVSGLAMGLGLDRLLMLRKGIDDIRLLRSADPRVREQMRTLDPYRTVSPQPPVRRDVSVAVATGTSEEELGDRVRRALGSDAEWIEEISIASRTPAEALPPAAVGRMGLVAGQENVLLKVVLRHPTRSLPRAEANRLRDVIYAAVHEGKRSEWAARQGKSRGGSMREETDGGGEP